MALSSLFLCFLFVWAAAGWGGGGGVVIVIGSPLFAQATFVVPGRWRQRFPPPCEDRRHGDGTWGWKSPFNIGGDGRPLQSRPPDNNRNNKNKNIGGETGPTTDGRQCDVYGCIDDVGEGDGDEDSLSLFESSSSSSPVQSQVPNATTPTTTNTGRPVVWMGSSGRRRRLLGSALRGRLQRVMQDIMLMKEATTNDDINDDDDDSSPSVDDDDWDGGRKMMSTTMTTKKNVTIGNGDGDGTVARKDDDDSDDDVRGGGRNDGKRDDAVTTTPMTSRRDDVESMLFRQGGIDILEELEDSFGELEPLGRQEIRLDGFEPYILVSVLTAQASFEEISTMNDVPPQWNTAGGGGASGGHEMAIIDVVATNALSHSPNGPPFLLAEIVPTAATLTINFDSLLSLGVLLSAALSAVTGMYATIVFSLCILYGKTALGMSRDDAYYQFMDETGIQRYRAFQAFSAALLFFSINIILLVVDHAPRSGRIPLLVGSGIVLYIGYHDYITILRAANRIFTTGAATASATANNPSTSPSPPSRSPASRSTEENVSPME